MRRYGLLIVLLIAALAVNAHAVYTAHIGGSANDNIYVKGPVSGGPDNSPLHESWDLITPGSPNYLGYYYRFTFYDGTLHIDPTGKVGFTEKIFGSGNQVGGGQYGTVNVEGYLTGGEIRPWKAGNHMELNVWGNGLIELSSYLHVGISDGGINEMYATLSDSGVVQCGDIDFYGAGSYLDIQDSAELLVLSASYSEADALADIVALNITNTTGEGLVVSTKGNYTSITTIPEPVTVLLLSLGFVGMNRRRR